ncbi:LVIVD repeat-containing protein [Carboxylicivirga sp. N1Y90]|uniref:LVIVD repeat-containing protein n=1 Tax=Carboxylicivirga fragile TaxID=3417571 RepID=UPI003D359687|nr:hypothetical protein [Marinilabiliaceae bacterium N1Y90]
MKNLTLLLIASLIGLFACQDKNFEEYQVNAPVYMTYEDLRKSVKITEEVPLEVPGKIYFKDNYIFINEIMKGVHVYDNSNPSSPVYKTFIEIPGNVDIAIKGSLLYADSYVDLVAIDVSSLDNIVEKHRLKDVFRYNLPPTKNDYRIGDIDKNKGVVVNWNQIEVREEVVDDIYNPYPFFEGFDYAMLNSSKAADVGGSPGAGIAGSMARFMLNKNYLYVIDQQWEIDVFDIADPASPVVKNSFYSNGVAETLFTKDDVLFIGGQNGMQIFDLSNGAEPVFISSYSHLTACDPVVVNDDYAFVTLHSNDVCGRVTNQLDVIDIRNLQTPILKNTVALTNPHGLGIDGDYLFVCDGDDGLRVFDATQPEIMSLQNQLKRFENINAIDVIPLGNTLLMIGEGGFYQYDYTDINNIQLLSAIEVQTSSN